MNKLLLTFAFLLCLSAPAFAQLVGTDIKPGDACTAAQEGHVARNASADRDVSEITLICDGTTWQSATGGGEAAGSSGHVQFNESNALAGDNGLVWDNTNKVLNITNNVTNPDGISFNERGTGFSPHIAFKDETSTKVAAIGKTANDGLAVYAGGNTTAGTEKMTIRADGDISVPGKVVGASAGVGAAFRVGNDVDLTDFNVANTMALYGVNDATVGGLKLGSGGPTLYGTTGFLGVGTTIPNTRLHVAGSVKIGDGAELCNAAAHEGAIRYLAATDAFQMCRNSATGWEAIGTGSGALPALTSANIWVGNASNAATAVAMSGDATLSNAGVLTIASNAIGSAEITNASIALADLSATGTASATTYLRGDNTWATIAAADAPTLDGLDSAQFLRSDADDSTTGRIASTGGLLASQVMATTTSGLGAFEARSQGSGGTAGAAFITFHRPSAYAAYFGIDTDNQLKFGGWSAGANAHKVWHAGNDGAASGLDADTLDGQDSAYFTNATNLASGTVPAARMPALTGDVTMTVGTTATNIAAGVVTATELADDAVTIPKLAATGTASATTFLRGDNTWAAPGGGGIGSVTIVSQNLFRQKTTISCPAGSLRVGCNHTTPSFVTGGDEESFGVRPTGTLGCECAYNTYNTTCYALCAQ